MQQMQQNAAETIADTGMQMKMQTIEQIIDFYYYKDDVDAEALSDGVYRGMMDAIGDPYSTYYSAAELKSLMEQTEGIYYGIGAYVALDTVSGLPKIASAIPGTPAEAADLRPDDIIYKVDGQEVYGMDLTAVTALIKGEEGTTVNLTIIREGESDYLSVDVVRKKVETPTVEYEMFDDGMAYIQIIEFNDATVPQFTDALAMAKGSDMQGLIIDLRANPGGNLDAVVRIAQMLLPEGLIVYTEDKYGNREEYKCDGKHEFEYPLVVLIDGNSASASEILAGSIQDYEIGTLVGTTTFGKGIVQQVITLNDQSAVKITVSSYYTPKGRNIHGVGIEPDIVCEFDGEAYYNEDFDNQLEYAKEVLVEKIAE
jgi:carboxyl-terminal processing protease